MIIHLGDETRAEVIDSVLGQLSDGIWENSSAMNKYWMFADVEGTDLVIDDEPFRDEQGWGRYGSTLKRTQNGFAGKSEKQIKDWFANKAKQVVKIWAEDESKDPKYIWNRANDDDIVDYMGGHKVRTITVADVYECYDFLKGRSGKKYGIAADPLPYEVECSTRRTFTKYPSNYVKAAVIPPKYHDGDIAYEGNATSYQCTQVISGDINNFPSELDDYVWYVQCIGDNLYRIYFLMADEPDLTDRSYAHFESIVYPILENAGFSLED